MSKLKKVLLMCTAYVLVAALAIGGTVAYLQDDDSDVNVMTLGNVQIAQHEYERVVDEKGNPVKGVEGTDFDANYGITESYKLQPFTQAKPAYPAVYQNGAMAWDEFQQLWNGVGAPGSNDLFDDSMKNVIDKFVFVENTGKSDAYYRTVIAIECPEGITEKAIHTNLNANSRFDYNDEVDGSQNAADSNKFYTTINGVRYLVYVATYTEILKPGEISRPSLLQVYLDPTVTNEDCAKFGETWDILVLSQAVQTAGFADAQTALDTAFGKIKENKTPWDNYGFEAPEIENNKASLSQNLILFEEPLLNTMDQNGFTFDGNGYTVEIQDVGGEIDETGTIPMSGVVFSSVRGGNSVVNDVTITGTMQMVTAGNYIEKQDKPKRNDFNTTFNNVNIVDAELIYFSNRPFTSALTVYGTFAMNNCEVTGNKISAASSKDVPVYDMAAVNQTDVTIKDSKIGSLFVDNQAWVAIYDSEIDVIDSIAISTSGLGKLVIGEGAKIGTINLSDTASYPATLTIEKGATVGAIVYKGVIYTQAEWMAR